MSDAWFRFWHRWLFAAAWATVALGLLVTFLDTRWMPLFPEAMNDAFWGTPEMPSEVVRYHRFTHGVTGATIVSWAVALLFVLHWPFRARRRWAYACFAVSLLSWFGPDTAMSLAHGAWPNAIFNLSALAMLGTPLPFLWPAFRASGAHGG